MAIPLHKELLKGFNITSVSRADLAQIGFKTDNIDDVTMTELAEKMSEAYCEQGFWIDLEIIAESLGIRRV